MSTVHLYAGAEATIQAMGLQPKEAEFVGETVFSYAYPKSLCGKICWVVYRIMEGIQGLFTDTNWGKAKKLMQERWSDTYIVNTEIGQLNQGIKNQMRQFFSNASESLLQFAVAAQEDRIPETAEFRALLEKSTVSTYVSKMIELTKKLTN